MASPLDHTPQQESGYPLWVDYALMHFTVFVWGFTGVLGKLITMPSHVLVWYRMGIAFVGLVVWLWLRKRPVLLPTKAALKTLGTGLIIALHWICFFEAIKVSNVSVALACMSTTTLFVSFVEPLFFRRKIIGYEVLLGLVVIGGLLMIFSFEPQYALGIRLAVVSAFLASVFGTINGLFAKKHPPGAVTVYEMLGGVIGISIYLAFSEPLNADTFALSMANLGWLLLLGLVCTAFAFVASVQVLKRLSPFTVSISINLEPVYAILLALLIFGDEEYMSGGFYTGAAVILLTVVANGILKAARRRKAKEAESVD